MIKGAFVNISPFVKLLLIFLIALTSSVVLTFLISALAIPFTGLSEFSSFYTGSASNGYLKFIQVVQGFSVFIIPSFFAAFLFSPNPINWLGFKRINFILVVLSVMIFVVCQPLVSHLAELNSEIILPKIFSPIENWMHDTENLARELVFRLLDTRHPVIIGFNIIMIAVVPAIGEEMLFRGSIQPVMAAWLKRNHAAIWITAFLFSAMHVQFLTFLPRFILGAILGYLFLYGKSLWLPIAGHFTNNLLSLLIFYFYRFRKPGLNPLDPQTDNYNIWMVTASIILVTVLLYYLKQRNKSEKLNNVD